MESMLPLTPQLDEIEFCDLEYTKTNRGRTQPWLRVGSPPSATWLAQGARIAIPGG